MEEQLHRLFSEIMARGGMEITYASGKTCKYGPDEPSVVVRFADAGAERAIARDPMLAIGEMYMDGRMILEKGNIYDFIVAARQNTPVRVITKGAMFMHLWRSLIAGTHRRTGLNLARRNIAHHYDLDVRMYRLFLDPDLNYTCAYYEHDDQELGPAQLAKQRHIAGKLLSKPGNTVIDLGCGWGGTGLYLAEVAELQTHAVTLSAEQARIAAQRSSERGANAVFKNLDYRHATGKYDHVVSIGLLEHVGLPQMQTFFNKVSELLDKKGTAVIHAMARTKPMRYSQPFGEKYIFPGGYIPAISEVLPAVEKAGLIVKDLEILPLHYARTCRQWRERFMANKDKVLDLYDERFLRMWEIYLAAAEAGFRFDRIHIFHLILAKHQDRIPIRRGWLEPEKERLKALEVDRPPLG